jgi:hypothetical protein
MSDSLGQGRALGCGNETPPGDITLADFYETGFLDTLPWRGGQS